MFSKRLQAISKIYFHATAQRRYVKRIECLPRCGAASLRDAVFRTFEIGSKMILEKININIRRAVLKDAAAVAALLHEAFAEHQSFYTDKAFAATTPSPGEIAERINKRAVWLALHNNNIVGTVSIFAGNKELYVRSMAVSPDARGKGIGKILMEHVQEMAFSNGCTFITLNTTPFLLQAIRLYESFGFKQQGPGEFYGTPLIRMIKNLNQQ